MKINDIYENISAQQRAVRQLPANFRPANTSPQLNGPYPGRNATRGYLVGESDKSGLAEFTGDEMQYATATAPTAADDPERQVGVLMFGRFGKTDPFARTAWAALQRELPQEYPNEQAAAAKVAEIAKDGGAIVTEKSRPEAERLVKRFQAYGLKSRIVDDKLQEQTAALNQRMPRIGDTLQWRTMKDPTTRTGTVLDIKGFDVTVKPKRLPGETVYPRPMGVNLANKQLTYRVIPAEQSMTQPGGWTPQTPLEGAEVSEVYNPLDDERREQRAMDRERQQFKRDELEFELGGEEERMRAYNTGTFYLRINGRIWRKNGVPVAFQGRQRAQRSGQTIKDRDPTREVVITRTPQDKLDEIDRRGFLKGLGSVAAGAALAKVPGQAQAKDPTGWTGDPNDVRGRARWIQAGRPGIDNNPAGRSYPEASFDRNNNTISYQGRNYRVQNVRSPDQISGAQTVAIPLAQLGQRSSSRRLYNLTPDGKAYSTSQTVRESHDPTYEDIVTNLKKKLGDYLQDVATAVKKDPDLIDKLPQRRQEVQAVKTIRTDDGHEIKIHGNEDDGFRISIKNQDLKSQFSNLDEAVMAAEIYCHRRKQKAASADYIDENQLDISSNEKTKRLLKSLRARYPAAQNDIEALVYAFHAGQKQDRRDIDRLDAENDAEEADIDRLYQIIKTRLKNEPEVVSEKQDACYRKVKSRYKVWPSAYASGALVQCRKKGAKNWGEKSKTPEEVELDESLKNKLAAAGVAATMALSPAHARVTDGGQSFAQQTAQQSSQHQSVKTPKQIPSKSYLQNVASGKSRSLMDPDTAKELLKKYYNEKSQVNEGWRETLAALAAAGIMALSPGVSAADIAADSQQVSMIATIVVDGEVKKLDLTAKGFRDVREVEKFLDDFFARQGMPWQGRIERGVPGSGQYQRLIVQ